jgi:FixJ family two-component response regulator
MPAPEAICIAIVDDDESLCRSLARLLKQAGFQPQGFHSAEEFLAAPGRARFECLVVDIQLGGMSGMALHRRLLADQDGTPVVFITAHDDPAARTEALGQGGAAFFRKTDDGTEIIEALRRVSRPGQACVRELPHRQEPRGSLDPPEKESEH